MLHQLKQLKIHGRMSKGNIHELDYFDYKNVGSTNCIDRLGHLSAKTREEKKLTTFEAS